MIDEVTRDYINIIEIVNDLEYHKRRCDAAEELCSKVIEDVLLEITTPEIKEMPEYIKWLSIINEKH